jgi:RHS repeat-associated protein
LDIGFSKKTKKQNKISMPSVAPCENKKKYEAFGNLVWEDGNHDDNREFTSKEKDPTGFHYFGARYYSGDIGRFLSPDPHTVMPGNIDLSNSQELNPYVYCHNDPLNYVDPNGLEEKEIITWQEVLVEIVETIGSVIDLRSLFKGADIVDEKNRSHNEEIQKVTEGTPEEEKTKEMYKQSSKKLVQDGIDRVFNNDDSSDSTDESSASDDSATQKREEKSVGEKINEGVRDAIKEEIRNRNRDDVILN